MGYALIWPACVLALIISIAFPGPTASTVLLVLLGPFALIGAIMTVRSAMLAREASPVRLPRATLANVIGWVEIVLSAAIVVLLAIGFTIFLEHDTL